MRNDSPALTPRAPPPALALGSAAMGRASRPPSVGVAAAAAVPPPNGRAAVQAGNGHGGARDPPDDCGGGGMVDVARPPGEAIRVGAAPAVSAGVPLPVPPLSPLQVASSQPARAPRSAVGALEAALVGLVLFTAATAAAAGCLPRLGVVKPRPAPGRADGQAARGRTDKRRHAGERASGARAIRHAARAQWPARSIAHEIIN